MKLFGFDIKRSADSANTAEKSAPTATIVQSGNGSNAVPVVDASQMVDFFMNGGKYEYHKFSKPLDFYKAYCRCPILSTIVSRKTNCFTKGKINLIDKKTELIDNSQDDRIFNLIKNPNPLQTRIQFQAQLNTFQHIWGYAVGLRVRPAGVKDATSAIWLIPNQHVIIEWSGKMFYQTNKRNMIKRVQFVMPDGTRKDLPKEDIHIFTHLNGCLTDGYLPDSPLCGLEHPIDNIIQAYESSNTLSKRLGAMGILSNKGKDAAGHYEGDISSEKGELQSEYRKYGLSQDQWQIIITSANLEWQSMALPIKDLMLDEQIVSRSKEIADKLGYPKYLLAIGDDGTFSNVKEARIFLYEETIVGEAEHFVAQLNEFIVPEGSNYRLEVDFSHVAVLQADAEKKAKAEKTNEQKLEIRYRNDIITRNQWLEAIGEDTITGGDVYKSEWDMSLKENQNNGQEEE
jgi:phage portal protein BeeE